MPVKIKCSNCEKVLNVPDAARGKAVKCPDCQTRISVPAESKAAKPAAAKPATAKAKAAKKSAAPIDSMEALVTFDMRRAEDQNARICPKCGTDLQYQDEEDNECPQCGFDVSVGGLGARARKKAMKGPDPADFYPGLIKSSWKFVGKNIGLAWRSVMYTLVALTVSLGCLFLYFYFSMWPTRLFFALVSTISFFVIPGWMWHLCAEVIKLTLERKDKFKRLNFDFFLSSALGAAFALWCCVFVAPIILIPAALGYFFVMRMGGVPEVVLPICIIVGLIPSIWMFPICMSHFAMPIQYRGWMVWSVVPNWASNVKPLSYWMLWFLITNSLNIAGLATIGIVYGRDLGTIGMVMERNADIHRRKFAELENPNAKKKQTGPVTPKAPIPDPGTVDFKPVIVPCIILAIMCVFNGFTGMFNMRTIGQFTYYNKAKLDLIDKGKEYKYVSKPVVDEDEDEKPKTLVQMAVETVVFFLVFDLLGLVGGMLYGSLTDVGMFKGILFGMWVGQNIASLSLWGQCIRYAFRESLLWTAITIVFGYLGFLVFVLLNIEERLEYLVKIIVWFVWEFVFVIVAVVMLVTGSITIEMPSTPTPVPIGADNDEPAKTKPAEPAPAAAPAAKPQEDAPPPL